MNEAVRAGVEGLGVSVTARRTRPSLIRRAVTGMADVAEFEVADRFGSFRVRYPDRPELLVDQVVETVRVALDMRARFGAALTHVKLISIDQGPQGFRSFRLAGIAQPNLGSVHLNASMFVPGERHRPAAPTTAHELWHQIELAFAARDYRASIEFRRALGAYFGVETIERAPADRLTAEVSAYAATKAIEATAELAKLWWMTRNWDDPPPVARHFGAVVDRFFPAP